MHEILIIELRIFDQEEQKVKVLVNLLETGADIIPEFEVSGEEAYRIKTDSDTKTVEKDTLPSWE